jgi:hypothetical protein
MARSPHVFAPWARCLGAANRVILEDHVAADAVEGGHLRVHRIRDTRMSFSNRILIGLGAGVIVGLFFGERSSALKWAADGFVKLLQMTVLPYVTVSIGDRYACCWRTTFQRSVSWSARTSSSTAASTSWGRPPTDWRP